jgi:hypothetical protein
MTKNDATRIGKNFDYMIRNLHKLQGNSKAMMKAGMAVLEHQFDSNHEYCAGWCPRKRMTTEQLEAIVGAIPLTSFLLCKLLMCSKRLYKR